MSDDTVRGIQTNKACLSHTAQKRSMSHESDQYFNESDQYLKARHTRRE